MKLSVIIPCYNAEAYLAQTLGAVLEQRLPADEIIVVDDGSTDGSLAIARQFETLCEGRVRVHSERSGSGPRSRNIGAAMATGDAMMFLDADDVLAPEALAALADALDGEPNGIAACPWRRLELSDGQWLSRAATCALRRSKQDALSAWLTGWYYPPCAVLWSREAFMRVGGWDETAALNQDGDIMMRALASGVSLIETQRGAAYYRKLPEGQISQSGKRFTYDGLRGRLYIINKIAGILKDQNRIDAYRAPISFAFALIAADATGRFGALRHQAQVLKRCYAPSILSRALARLRRRASGSRPAPLPPYDQDVVIDFGLARATVILAADFAIDTQAPGQTKPQPAVSVIVPVYNRASMLSQTLNSVLNQTFSDFELLVIDDCSQDNPETVIAGLQDPRVRYFRQLRNQGVAAARNRGLREARAPLVAFLDDDDEWLPEKLTLQVALFGRSAPDVGLIYTGVETVFDGGVRELFAPTARGDLYQELLVRNILHGAPSSGMMRRNVIATVGFFDEQLPAIEDYDYWLRVCRHYKVDCISLPLVRYNDLRADAGDEQKVKLRRSLNIQANLDARARLYQRYGADMRAAGVAHLFLVDSANRHIVPEWNDFKTARKLALRAFLLAPLAWGVRNLLRKTIVPGSRR